MDESVSHGEPEAYTDRYGPGSLGPDVTVSNHDWIVWRPAAVTLGTPNEGLYMKLPLEA
jgi:hypothetical protein